MSKLPLISIALVAVASVIFLPFMEIGETHLINPDWPSHARLHNAWQLLTNGALSIFGLFLVWKGIAPKVGLGIVLIINISFMIAFLSASLYGGSMINSDGSEAAIGGINIGVAISVTLITLLLLGYRAVSKQANVKG